MQSVFKMCQHYLQHNSVIVCKYVRERERERDEHLESFAASVRFPQRSLNREDEMFSHPGCSYYILTATLTPEQCLQRELLLTHLSSEFCCEGKEFCVPTPVALLQK